MQAFGLVPLEDELRSSSNVARVGQVINRNLHVVGHLADRFVIHCPNAVYQLQHIVCCFAGTLRWSHDTNVRCTRDYMPELVAG